MSTTPVRHPHRVAVWLVRLAARPLPGGGPRERYRDEFVAELYGLSRTRQARHAVSVAILAWSLRSAVRNSPVPGILEASMTTTKTTRPLLCRLNLRHEWRIDSTEDGSRYRHCMRCGKVWDGDGPNPGYAMWGSTGT